MSNGTYKITWKQADDLLQILRVPEGILSTIEITSEERLKVEAPEEPAMINMAQVGGDALHEARKIIMDLMKNENCIEGPFAKSQQEAIG